MSVFQKDSTALITGGASGIGLALAKHCLSNGMRVIIADIFIPALPLEPNLLSYKIDVSDPNQWADLKGLVDKEFKGLFPSPFLP